MRCLQENNIDVFQRLQRTGWVSGGRVDGGIGEAARDRRLGRSSEGRVVELRRVAEGRPAVRRGDRLRRTVAQRGRRRLEKRLGYRTISETAKIFQFKLARALARKKELDLGPIDQMAALWDKVTNVLTDKYL